MAQSLMRSMKRGNLGRISSTKVSKHSTAKNIRRKNRFGQQPSKIELQRRERRQRKIDSPEWNLIEDQWVHSSKISV